MIGICLLHAILCHSHGFTDKLSPSDCIKFPRKKPIRYNQLEDSTACQILSAYTDFRVILTQPGLNTEYCSLLSFCYQYFCYQLDAACCLVKTADPQDLYASIQAPTSTAKLTQHSCFSRNSVLSRYLSDPYACMTCWVLSLMCWVVLFFLSTHFKRRGTGKLYCCWKTENYPESWCLESQGLILLAYFLPASFPDSPQPPEQTKHCKAESFEERGGRARPSLSGAEERRLWGERWGSGSEATAAADRWGVFPPCARWAGSANASCTAVGLRRVTKRAAVARRRLQVCIHWT